MTTLPERKGGLVISSNHPDAGEPLTLDMLRHTYVTTEDLIGDRPIVLVRLGGPYKHLGYEWNFAAFKLRVESGWLADGSDIAPDDRGKWRNDIQSLPSRAPDSASDGGAQ